MSPQAGDDPGTPEQGGEVDRVVDARGERCPLPVIRLARLVRDEPHVRRVTVLATDPAAAHDIPAWCRMRGQRFVETRAEDDHTAYVVEVVRPSTPEAAR
ncbi:sulfurtransferase TusA family protein [Terrabacter sp. 2RAF25]|uniref:sulfurtransferase TusA family protein n=1 Tax=Terrabacter sp. 2RAF25 TaxID=3232998 RepID=UPI003F994A6B